MANATINYPIFHATEDDGGPLIGGLLYTYVAGTTTNKATYSNSACTSANTNPVVLNSRGEAVIYGIGSYTLVLKDGDGNTIWTHIFDSNSQSETAIYFPSSDATDHGITGSSNTIKYYVDIIGTTNKATIFLKHDSEAEWTDYIFLTSETVPSNLSFQIEWGARLSIATGKTLTTYSPANIIAQPNQQIVTGAGTLSFTKSDGIRYPNWWGVTGDGTTNDYLAFRSAFNAVSGGQVHILPATSGTYLVDTPSASGHLFTISYPVTITSDKGALIKLKSSSLLHQTEYMHMFVVLSHDVTLEGLQIDANYRGNAIYGGNSASAGAILLLNDQAGIYHVNYEVKNCWVYDSGFTSIGVGSIGPSDTGTVMRDVKIHHNYIELGYQDQIPISFAQDVKVHDNTLVNGDQYSIHPYTYATAVNITDNYIRNTITPTATFYGIGVGHNSFPDTVSLVSVIANTVDMTSDSVSRQGIIVWGEADNVVLTSNKVYGGLTGIAVGWGATHINVANNITSHQHDENIMIRGCAYSTFENNTLHSANQEGGITDGDSAFVIRTETSPAYTADYNTIRNNNFHQGSETNKPVHAIYVAGGANAPTNTLIIGNRVENGSSGTAIEGYSATNIVKENKGWITENGSITSAIASGATIAHGLVAAPAVVTIAAATAGKEHVIVTADATNLTVTYAGGGTCQFYWSARTW